MRKKISIIICVLLIKGVYAQDTYLSQFYASPLNFNPASVGLHNGIFRVTANARQQFGDFSGSDNSFKNFVGSFDVPIKSFGIGAIVKGETKGLFTTVVADMAIGYNFKIGKKKYNNLAIGVQGGVTQMNFNTDKAIFGDPEQIANPNILNPDLHAGLFYYNSNIKAKMNPFFGASVYRIIEHTNSNFTGSTNNSIVLGRKINAFAGVQINTSKKFDFVPHVFAINEFDNIELSPGIFSHYFLRDDDASLMIGVQARIGQTIANTQVTEIKAIIPQVGFQYRDFMFGFSYDFNTSRLSNAINGGNDGFELSLIYIKRKNIKLKEDFICPRL